MRYNQVCITHDIWPVENYTSNQPGRPSDIRCMIGQLVTGHRQGVII